MSETYEETSQADMQGILDRQRQAYLAEGVVSAATRVDRLERAIQAVKKHQKAFVEAMNDDFGHRSEHQSLFTDIASSIGPLRHAQQHLKHWMKKDKRKVTPGILALLGAKSWVEYQPLGVVGVISPWNFPVNLTFTPLAGILSAGNRCMIKPSEYTPATSAAMAVAFAEAFDEEEIAVVTGGPQTGADFSGLAFDHLLFTGATSVAKHVMRAASANLEKRAVAVSSSSSSYWQFAGSQLELGLVRPHHAPCRLGADRGQRPPWARYSEPAASAGNAPSAGPNHLTGRCSATVGTTQRPDQRWSI